MSSDVAGQAMQYIPKVSAIPPEVLSAADYEGLAASFIPPDVLAYINGGAGRERTLNNNLSAFQQLQITPRVLRDFSTAGTSCTVLGHRLSQPFLLGPVAHQKLVHPEGELATAEAAEVTDTGFIASTLSSVAMEDIAAATGACKWFQLYWQPDRAQVLELLRRAERAHYSAIVVTVDVAVNALRYREQRAGFVHPAELPAINLATFPATATPATTGGNSVILHGIMPTAPTWQDLDWLRSQTGLPILVKGVLSAQDAVLAEQMGFQGVVVSNHGGRSLDGVPAALAALKPVRTAVGDDFTVLMDSGIRHGSDVFKAIALGADAVLIGRLQVHALSVAGALGVAHMLSLLRQELEVVMALSGCATVQEIRATAPVQWEH